MRLGAIHLFRLEARMVFGLVTFFAFRYALDTSAT